MVEGYMDVIALAQHGIDNTVATLGTAVTEKHLEKLYRVAGRLIFCFDGDEAGKKAAWRALEIALPLLREGRQALFNFMPEGHDPDSFIREYGAEQFRADERTVPLSDFLLDKLKSGAGIATREGRATFLDLVLPYLARMPGSGLRQLLLQEAAATAQIDGDGLQETAAGLPPRQGAPAPRLRVAAATGKNRRYQRHHSPYIEQARPGHAGGRPGRTFRRCRPRRRLFAGTHHTGTRQSRNHLRRHTGELARHPV